MEITVIGPKQLPDLHVLLTRALRLERFSAELIHEKLFENRRPELDECSVFAAVEGGRLYGAMQSIIRRRDRRAWLGLFAVGQRHQRVGIATQLFEHVKRQWQAAGVAEAEVLAIPGNYFSPGLDPRYTPALCFVERQGFVRFRDCVNLIADLTGPEHLFDTSAGEQELASRNIEVRRATRTDGPLLDAFFATHFGPDWRLEAAKAHDLDPPGLHLALEHGTIIAFAAHSGMNREWGFFGPMGTAPAAEGNGVGRVLLKRCLADLKAAEHVTAVIPWVGPIAFYARAAPCRVHRVFWRYKLQVAT